MDITPLISQGQKLINRYGNQSFTINGEKFLSNIFICADKVMKWEFNDEISQLSPNDFDLVIKTSKISPIKILLLGIGEKIIRLPFEIYAELKKYNITIDIMSSASAVRTYNILTSEGREVAALIIAI